MYMITNTTELKKDATISSDDLIGLKLTIINSPTVNYAAVQNQVPIIQSIYLENISNKEINHIDLTIDAYPSFIIKQKLHFDRLLTGEIKLLSSDHLCLKPDHEYFSMLNEKELGYIELSAQTEEGKEIRLKSPIEILAYNEWAGTRGLAQLLAAFIQPNSLAIDRLLGQASDILKKNKPSLFLDGYQSKNREKVWQQISAIFGALCLQKIQYASPPASFESQGQKIRNTDRILDARIATCLDSSILIASCLEQAGLNPIIAFKEAHAWVGVWLIDNCFQTPIIDCAQSLRKRIDSGELLMLEATAITQDKPLSMEWARNIANTYLKEETTTFTYAIDIKRARIEHIRPLNEKTNFKKEINTFSNAISDEHVYTIEEMPLLPPLDPEVLPISEVGSITSPEGRLIRWKGKLMDLTLRNKLLNFKPGKLFLKLICSDPHFLEDLLNTEGEFKLSGIPALMEGHDPRSSELFFKEKAETVIETYAKTALNHRELIFDIPSNQFDTRLIEIYRAAKNTLEETGANTLYISIGILNWKESPQSEITLKAPLLLVPVTLKRKTVGAGTRLIRHDDETIFNPTLLEKLILDFKISLSFINNQLPLDEKGVNVNLIFQKVRVAIAELEGFELRPDCYIGNFSFTKYVMWKDANDNTHRLLESPIIDHILNRKLFSKESKLVDPNKLDQEYFPHRLFTPLIADSSQLAVVCTASLGKNIVVEGPPGTGKSQTITNIIAHYLASGKTVLFVAEKMAALEIVHKRLSDLGLAEFCLELHSSKAKKSELAKELIKKLNSNKNEKQINWKDEAEKLSRLRSHLTNFVKTLHKKHDNGLSVYKALGTCIANTGKTPANLNWPYANSHNIQQLEFLNRLVTEISASLEPIENIGTHPLLEIGHKDWTPSWQDNLLHLCSILEESIKNLNATLQAFTKIIPLNLESLSLDDLMTIDKLAQFLIELYKIPPQLIKHAHQKDYRHKLQNLILHGKERNKIFEKIRFQYSDEIKLLDAQLLLSQWRISNQYGWTKKWFSKRKIISQIKLYHLQGIRLKPNEVEELLTIVKSLNEEDKNILENTNFAQEILGYTFSGINTDWELVQNNLNFSESFATLFNDIYKNQIDEIINIRSNFQMLIDEKFDLFSPDAPYSILAINLQKAYAQFLLEWEKLNTLVSPRRALCGGNKKAGILTLALSMINDWKKSRNHLQAWCLWQLNKSKAYDNQLKGLIDFLESGDIQPNELTNFFDFSYKNWWIKKIIDNEPLLSNFSSSLHEQKISDFKKMDEQFQQLTKEYIIATLNEQVPSEKECNDILNNEIRFLHHEAQKKRQHKPIREVIKQSRHVLTKLKPCLLMSPLSVAQYLDISDTQFDVVIFDEASQMPTWDAIGAIARGKQLICVGDPNQLPPTNFFNNSDSDGVIDEDNIETMESILDECLSIGMMCCTLDWHYRSKSEGLISFSNIEYYNNRLITFPAPVTKDKAVQLILVDGIYDAGKSRTNNKEAEAIVEAIAEHYLSGKGKELSIGIITFNAAQEMLINKLLDDKRLKNRELDNMMSENTIDSLLIKNLENVQGNERDIILFSTTFGKDANGKISINFGPINKEGGHRRLNVAVSRARYEVRIFSSLRPEEIDLSRSKARGLADFKKYLSFALNGSGILYRQALPTGEEPDSPFEMEVIKILRDHGWEVHPQVGVSGYKIDLAIVNPHEKGCYLLGIECDGASYHSAPTARDRDRLRQMILEDLGWKIYRIWSTDWWLNRDKQIEKLLQHLKKIEQESANKKN